MVAPNARGEDVVCTLCMALVRGSALDLEEKEKEVGESREREGGKLCSSRRGAEGEGAFFFSGWVRDLLGLLPACCACTLIALSLSPHANANCDCCAAWT